ncbi:hypothetical protein [Brevibacillus agri]|nr:hypothetical protein [Brevibacillus agri]
MRASTTCSRHHYYSGYNALCTLGSWLRHSLSYVPLLELCI